MAISKYTQDNEKKKFKESTSTAGQPGVVVINPDGSSISGGTGASSGQVQGTAADNAAAVGNPVRVGQVYNSATQTYGSGDIADFQADVNGNTKVTLATKLDPVNDGVTSYEDASYITTISTATTTVVAAFPAVVKEIRVIGGTLGNVTVYDNTAASGSPVIPAVTPDKGQLLLGKGANFAVGCTVVTAAATIVTVIWRQQ